MQKLNEADLLSLERYSRERPEFRARVMAHKKNRQLNVGPNTMWLFEDRITVQYQVQEMLRTEFPDPEVRRVQLERLHGIEDRCWVQVAGYERLYAIADEDMERENEVKTSAVHFLRFELAESMVAALKRGVALAAGVDHPNYRHQLEPLPENVRAALVSDLA